MSEYFAKNFYGSLWMAPEIKIVEGKRMKKIRRSKIRKALKKKKEQLLKTRQYNIYNQQWVEFNEN